MFGDDPYLFTPSTDCNLDAMKGLSRCNDPDSDADGSIATGSGSLAGKVDDEY